MFLQIYIHYQVVQIQIKRNMVSETSAVVSKNVCIFSFIIVFIFCSGLFFSCQILVASFTAKSFSVCKFTA